MKPTSYITPEHSLVQFPHIVSVCCAVNAKAQQLSEHRNPGFEICYAHSGAYAWNIEGQAVHMKSGQASITSPTQTHSGLHNTLNKGILYWTIVQPDNAVTAPYSLGSWCYLDRYSQHQLVETLLSIPVPLFERMQSIGKLIDEIHQELTAKQFAYVDRINNHITDILITIARAHTTQHQSDVDDGFFTQFRQEILACPGKRWTISDLCVKTGYQKSALHTFFKRNTGLSPLEFVHHVKLHYARELLQLHSCTYVAHELGYSSLQHFSKAFKAYTGHSPSTIPPC